MTDIAIAWDVLQGEGDWDIAAGDLATGSDLESAVMVSLFTDRRAAPDFVLTDGSDDRRGWWADTYEGEQIGSRIWQFERRKKSDGQVLLLEMRRACEAALQWLITDGIAASVSVSTGWRTATVMAVSITITRPAGDQTTFAYSWAWSGI